jgi:hypothetical protein
LQLSVSDGDARVRPRIVTFRRCAMPSKRANVKNEKQYEELKKQGMSKSRAAKIANSPGASKRGGKSSGSARSRKSSGAGSGGNRSQKARAGRKGGKATARKR